MYLSIYYTVFKYMFFADGGTNPKTITVHRWRHVWI